MTTLRRPMNAGAGGVRPEDSAQRLRDFLEDMDPEDFGNVSP